MGKEELSSQRPDTATYTCENCHEKFEKGWSDEEQRAEYERVFQRDAATGQPKSVVCDKCYRAIMRWARQKGLTPSG